jgi:hypothetical protein
MAGAQPPLGRAKSSNLTEPANIQLEVARESGLSPRPVAPAAVDGVIGRAKIQR